MSLAELRILPPLTYVLDQILPVKSLFEMYGPRKAGKTFFALADIQSNWRLVGVPVHIDVHATMKEFLKAIPEDRDLIIVDTLMRNMAGHISDPKDIQPEAVIRTSAQVGSFIRALT